MPYAKSTRKTDALLYAPEKMRSDTDNNKMLAAASLDLSKAFDSIFHEFRLEKFKKFGFDQVAISSFKKVTHVTERKKLFSKIQLLIG